MASDTEDLELESLRSAVLASLKTKPSGEATKAGSVHPHPAKAVAEEEEDDEDLEALRLAALQSKKEAGSTSHISTPVTGSPNHASSSPIPQPPRQELPHRQEAPVKPDPPSYQRGATTRSNLITIPLQDFSKPVQPTPPVAPRINQTREVNDEEVSKEEQSTKFSRFDDSDSESEDDFLLGSESSSLDERDKRGFDSESNDRRSQGTSSSSSEAERSDASSSDEESDRESVSSDSEQAQSEDSTSEEDAQNSDIVKDDADRTSDQDRQSMQKDESTKTNKVSEGENKSNQRTSEGDRREKHSDLRTKLSTDRDRDRNRRERNVPRKDERREDYYRRHRERDKQREERERNYAARRERKHSPERSFRSRRETSNRDIHGDVGVDQRTLQARRQKFASRHSVSIKDRTIGLKGLKASENGARASEGKDQTSESAQGDQELKTDLVKDTPEVESDSDISLSSEQFEQSDEEVKEKKDSDSDSESDGETSRFKHTSSTDTKMPVLEPSRSRLITSMTFPKEGSTDILPRRRPHDGEPGRARWERDDKGVDRRPRDIRDRERDFGRRPHLPRYLERQARSSSRDKLRDSELDSRSLAKDGSINDRHVRDKYDGRRHPRDRDLNDRVVADGRSTDKQSKEVSVRSNRLAENVDSRPVSRKTTSVHDFVSESSESDTESGNQPLRSIVKADKPAKDTCITITTSTEKRPRTKERDENERSRRKEKSKEKRHKHKRDVKDRIGSRKKEERGDEGNADEDMAEVRRVTLNEDPGGQKKRSVLDRLGTAPSPERLRSSVKSRLGPVGKKLDSVPIESEEDFLPHESIGPDGDSMKLRRTVEIDDSYSDRLKKRVKLKHPDSDDNIERKETGDMFTVAEAPIQRKQLSKSLLSRLSERPSTPLEADDARSPHRSSPTPEPEPKERRVRAREEDEVARRKKEKKSKSREIWSSRRKAAHADDFDEEELSGSREHKSEIRSVLSKRNAIALDDDMDYERLSEDRRTKVNEVWSSKSKDHRMDEKTDVKVTKDEALDERIRKIKAKNAAILQRQKEIEEEKKMFGGRR